MSCIFRQKQQACTEIQRSKCTLTSNDTLHPIKRYTYEIYCQPICRILLGLVFIGSGFVKGIDPLGSEYKFIEYFNAFGLGSLNASALFFSFLLSGLEFLYRYTASF